MTRDRWRRFCARWHFRLRPYKRGFYDGLAASRDDPPYFGG